MLFTLEYPAVDIVGGGGWTILVSKSFGFSIML